MPPKQPTVAEAARRAHYAYELMQKQLPRTLFKTRMVEKFPDMTRRTAALYLARARARAIQEMGGKTEMRACLASTYRYAMTRDDATPGDIIRACDSLRKLFCLDLKEDEAAAPEDTAAKIRELLAIAFDATYTDMEDVNAQEALDDGEGGDGADAREP